VTVAAEAAPVPAGRRAGVSWQFGRRFLRRKTAVFGLLLVVVVVGMAVGAPILAPFAPTLTVAGPNQSPSAAHLLGTDQVGRDLLSLTIYGARASLEVGVGAQMLSAIIGVVLGMFAGYFGGRTDALLMRVVDIFMAFPFILLAILLVAAIGPGIRNVILAIGLTAWTTTCRIIRAQTLSLREELYIEAARAIGASNLRILGGYVLPNLVPLSVTMFTIGIGTAIVAESSLSFLGLGIQPPIPSWGKTLAFGQVVVFTAPHLAIVPSVAILMAVLGFNLVGDGVRDAVDPREVTVRGQFSGG